LELYATNASPSRIIGGDGNGKGVVVPPRNPRSFRSFFSILTFTSVLLNAVRRLVPIALAPLKAPSSPASPSLILSYVLSVSFFLYYEAYKGFHKKFVPAYVSRSQTLPSKNILLSFIPVNVLYSGGYICSNKARKAKSYGVTMFVFLAIVVSKRLPPAPRGVVDAGVVAGLTGAIVSLWAHWFGCAWQNSSIQGWGDEKLEF